MTPAYQLLATSPAELRLSNQLTQIPEAMALARWLAMSSVEVRTVKSSTALPGMALFSGRVVVGNPEITRECLGAEAMAEFGLTTLEGEAMAAARQRFEAWWEQGVDIKPELLVRIEVYWQGNSPQFLYFLSLWHLFKDGLPDYRAATAEDRRLDETPIWRKLFAFQRHGAMEALNKLKTQGGCIVADSVGLGKTYTALAVIKAYERMGKSVLVLCPKKLRHNWEAFLRADGRAPFRDAYGRPDFHYYVLAHTDLAPGRKVMPGAGGRVAIEDFLMQEIGLIVIDECHNFKSHGSRRHRFLLRYLRAHCDTKLLMLSATPVNNRLAELTHQLALIQRIDLTDGAENENLPGFRADVSNILRRAQRAVNAWNHDHADDTQTLTANALADILPEDYFHLLERYTIARNRAGILRFYADAANEVGAFPKVVIENHTPDIDTQGKGEDITAMSQSLESLTLAAYNPLAYLRAGETLRSEGNLNDRTRQRALVALMRMNALKRLESSVASFRATLEEGFLRRMNLQLEALGRGRLLVPSVTAEALEEDTFVPAEAPTNLHEILSDRFDVARLKSDILSDIATLEALLARARDIGPERDAKVHHLCSVLQNTNKALIFTSFADTAEALAKALRYLAPHRAIACLTGSHGHVYEADGTDAASDMVTILTRFAPVAQEAREPQLPIEWLVATDCLSEGQNLQDCDTLINYDVHWSPLKLEQRAGRINRIGSRNPRVTIHNFWPMHDLDAYIGLERRVRLKDALAGTVGAGGSNLDAEAKIELKYREQQLRRMKDGHLDEAFTSIADRRNGFAEYLAELDAWLRAHPEDEVAFRMAPLGLCAVSPATVTKAFQGQELPVPKAGALFLLRRTDLAEAERAAHPLGEHFLVAVDAGGNALTSGALPIDEASALALFRALCRDRAAREGAPACVDKTLSPLIEGALLQLNVARQTTRARLLFGDVPFDYHTGQTDERRAFVLETFILIGEVAHA